MRINKILILVNTLILLLSLVSAFGQKTVFVELSLSQEELEFTVTEPFEGQYTIKAYSNGLKNIQVRPYENPLYPNIICQITFNSEIDLLTFEIESPGYETFSDGVDVSLIEDDTVSFANISLTRSEFPIITTVNRSSTNDLYIFEVEFDNPIDKRFIIDKIDLNIEYFYDFSTLGINSSNLPEKTFIIDDQLVVNSENSLEIIYKDKDNPFDAQYLAKGELQVYPLKKVISLNYTINTQLEFKSKTTFKTSIALPRIFRFQNLQKVDEYFKSKSIEISSNIIKSLQNFTKLNLTFYSSSDKNSAKYEWSE